MRNRHGGHISEIEGIGEHGELLSIRLVELQIVGFGNAPGLGKGSDSGGTNRCGGGGACFRAAQTT